MLPQSVNVAVLLPVDEQGEEGTTTEFILWIRIGISLKRKALVHRSKRWPFVSTMNLFLSNCLNMSSKLGISPGTEAGADARVTLLILVKAKKKKE